MYKLSRLAAEDFAAIYEYTLLNFGVSQADAYTQALEKVLTLLSEHPFIGIASEEIGKNIRRHDHQHHAIFYRSTDGNLFVLRILHQQMAATRHLFE
ncbi:type II toxin-antitoxin system RelE/ParE family toxin [Alishewanella sp. d11]|uniref:type II toxin-antitoxin system RelE/ParE family toxin n=1 Tax=Alishewanella sp. d11 TaxID=3414030 RepID=UPI003BF83003